MAWEKTKCSQTKPNLDIIAVLKLAQKAPSEIYIFFVTFGL